MSHHVLNGVVRYFGILQQARARRVPIVVEAQCRKARELLCNLFAQFPPTPEKCSLRPGRIRLATCAKRGTVRQEVMVWKARSMLCGALC